LNLQSRKAILDSADRGRKSILKTLHKEGGKALSIQGSAYKGRISILKTLHKEGG
jgi:hypothetical protein